jgi:hypothetical protein
VSLIDEALRRAQASRGPGDGAPSPPADSWSAAPLPDRGRARRRVRAVLGAGAAVLLLGGGAAFLLLRRGAASESSTAASPTAGQERPHRQATLAGADATPPPLAEAFLPERAGSPRTATSGKAEAGADSRPGGLQPSARHVQSPAADLRPAALPPSARHVESPAFAGGPAVAAPATARLPSEPSLRIRSASSSPRIAAPAPPSRIAAPPAPVPAPVSRVHAPAAGAASERGRAVHVGEVSVPGGHIELGGIVYSDTNPVALLNGRTVGVGGMVEGFTVVSIEESRVELTNDHRTIVLTLR